MSQELRQLFADIVQPLDPAADRQTIAIIRGLEAVASQINDLSRSLKVVPDQLSGGLQLLEDLKLTLDQLPATDDD